jgi:hypothetical protein
MELTLEPEIYAPSINEYGNYVDNPGTGAAFRPLRCACGCRRDQLYKTIASFKSHIKSQCHISWLEDQNNNKQNHLVNASNNAELLNQQRLQIARMSLDVEQKNHHIGLMTKRITELENKAKSHIFKLD